MSTDAEAGPTREWLVPGVAAGLLGGIALARVVLRGDPPAARRHRNGHLAACHHPLDRANGG